MSTKALCEQEGIIFEPIVVEAQGGIELRAAAILHRIAESVAAVEDGCAARLKACTLHRISVIIARCSASAIRRRAPPKATANQIQARRVLAAAHTLQEESGT